MKILIVDDDAFIRKMICGILEEKPQIKIITATNGEEGVEKFKEEIPDLVILDVEMPKLNGYQTCNLIREFEKKNKNETWTPIIFLSAKLEDKDLEKGIQAGGDDYLFKPINPIILLSKIHAMNRIRTMRIILQQKTNALKDANQKITSFYNRLMKINQEKEYTATHDILTSLPNRFLINDRIEQAIKQAKAKFELAAIMIIDIDNFREFNENFGHKTGDEVLVATAKSLLSCVNDLSTVGRLGSDDFVIILPAIENENIVAQVADSLISNLTTCLSIEGKITNIGVNVGIATYPNDGSTAEQLLANADLSMSYAKETGSNKYQFYNNSIDGEIKQKRDLITNIKQSLNNSDFFLNFQPQVDFKNKKNRGIEVLIRWKHPEKGEINPQSFIPIAEETGFIRLIDNWMFEKACEQYNSNPSYKQENLTLGLNTSPVELLKPGFTEQLIETARKYNIPNKNIEVEITENVFLHDTERLGRILHKLKDSGFKIAIDDFGTGYSSLSYIANLNIDTIKIDKSLIANITENKRHQIVTKHIIDMCNELDISIIAEGVEFVEQAELLLNMGCHFMQGFLFSRPSSEQSIGFTLEYLSNKLQRKTGS